MVIGRAPLAAFIGRTAASHQSTARDGRPATSENRPTGRGNRSTGGVDRSTAGVGRSTVFIDGCTATVHARTVTNAARADHRTAPGLRHPPTPPGLACCAGGDVRCTADGTRQGETRAVDRG